MLELADRSKIKLEGVLDDVIISLDCWEYLADFIVLQPKNPVGGHPLILGQPRLAIADAYIGCRSGDMYISHGDSRKKVTLYPLARSIQDLQDTLWLDQSSDEETQSISLIQHYTGSLQEDEIQDFLKNLDTMCNFEPFSHIFSLDFQENHDSHSSIPLSLTTPLSTPKPNTTLFEISPGKSLHISSDWDSSQ